MLGIVEQALFVAASWLALLLLLLLFSQPAAHCQTKFLRRPQPPCAFVTQV